MTTQRNVKKKKKKKLNVMVLLNGPTDELIVLFSDSVLSGNLWRKERRQLIERETDKQKRGELGQIIRRSLNGTQRRAILP